MTTNRFDFDEASPVVYSIARAAQVLGVGVTTTKHLVGSGALRSFRIGTRVLISRSAIEEFVLAREHSGTATGAAERRKTGFAG